MWLRRQTTKFNGVPYIIQRGAEAVFSEEGIKQCRESIAYYQENARIIMEGFDKVGIKYYGGVHSPYIWLQCPNGMSSWEFFDFLLEKLQVVGTPGAGFGKMGEGFFRLTAFGSRENTIEAMERIINGLKNKLKYFKPYFFLREIVRLLCSYTHVYIISVPERLLFDSNIVKYYVT